MEGKPKSSNALTIVLVILGLLISCGLGAVLGGAAGFFAGRRSAATRHSQSFEWRIVPEEATPAPRVPRATPPVGLPSAEEGALITNVVPDGPADGAGLRRGDIILAVDDQRVGPDSDLRDILAEYEPGDTAELTISRAGDELTVSVELGRNPDAEDKPWLGIYYRMLATDD
jgi:S1-C subfamily serine protease